MCSNDNCDYEVWSRQFLFLFAAGALAARTCKEEVFMTAPTQRRQSSLANGIYQLFNPIPFGFFVAALIFDVVYFQTAEMMWSKSAAWLITIGLFFAIIPRLINLVHVWIPRGRVVLPAEKLDFGLNFIGIVAAIINAFIHSRDAYAVMPSGLILSVVTVACFAVAAIVASTFYAIGRTHNV
ncbi:putative membrane protein [Advenella incenata]|jgi:uncharacterized membrane protein|uniref:Putative membrane protein n=2 Tax=Advenella incenata TaxID=267800 RepID=A0A4Q7VA96_9BURK|nr:putative membrane protein [Advenella incenata]